MKEGSESGESRGEEEAEERDAASTLRRRQTTSRRRRAPSTPCARPSCRFPAGAVPPPCLALNTDESPRRTPSHVPHRAGHTFSLMPTPVQEGVALRQGRRRRRGSHVHLHHDDVPFRNYAGRSFCTTTPSSALHQSPRPPCFLPRLALHRARRFVIMFEDPSCDDREDLGPEGRLQPLLLYDDYRADSPSFIPAATPSCRRWDLRHASSPSPPPRHPLQSATFGSVAPLFSWEARDLVSIRQFHHHLGPWSELLQPPAMLPTSSFDRRCAPPLQAQPSQLQPTLCVVHPLGCMHLRCPCDPPPANWTPPSPESSLLLVADEGLRCN